MQINWLTRFSNGRGGWGGGKKCNTHTPNNGAVFWVRIRIRGTLGPGHAGAFPINIIRPSPTLMSRRENGYHHLVYNSSHRHHPDHYRERMDGKRKRKTGQGMAEPEGTTDAQSPPQHAAPFGRCKAECHIHRHDRTRAWIAVVPSLKATCLPSFVPITIKE